MVNMITGFDGLNGSLIDNVIECINGRTSSLEQMNKVHCKFAIKTVTDMPFNALGNYEDFLVCKSYYEKGGGHCSVYWI